MHVNTACEFCIGVCVSVLVCFGVKIWSADRANTSSLPSLFNVQTSLWQPNLSENQKVRLPHRWSKAEMLENKTLCRTQVAVSQNANKVETKARS